MMKMLITITLFLICLKLTAPPNPAITIIEAESINVLLTWSNIESYMSEIDIRQPEIVRAQIKHETGNLTSRFCLEQNNLFGMRLARVRKTTAIGEGNHMAIYRSWQESLLDYKIWQDTFYNGGDYCSFLSKHGYATDPYYLWKLKRLI